MKQDIENIIKKNLPEKKEFTRKHTISNRWERTLVMEYNQALSQINTSLIADEVLKVVVEKIGISFDYKDENEWCVQIWEGNTLLKSFTKNSVVIPNKENKNNENTKI